jgi:hypothetical protein
MEESHLKQELINYTTEIFYKASNYMTIEKVGVVVVTYQFIQVKRITFNKFIKNPEVQHLFDMNKEALQAPIDKRLSNDIDIHPLSPQLETIKSALEDIIENLIIKPDAMIDSDVNQKIKAICCKDYD